MADMGVLPPAAWQLVGVMTGVSVWRVEHACGCGPYTARELCASCVDAREAVWDMCYDHDDDWHPSPWDDGIRDFTEEHICGLPTLESVKSWFNDFWTARLHEHGYRLTEWSVPEEALLRGRVQVMFDPRASRLVQVSALV